MAGGALEAYVTNVQNMSASGSLRELTDISRRAVDDVLANNIQHLDHALATLSLGEHSIGILAMLTAKMKQAISQNQLEPVEAVVAQVREFVSGCNGEHIRAIPDMYCDLFHKIADYYLLKKNEPDRGITLLANAIDRLATSKSQLTSLHAALCCLCLKARNLQAALPFLDADMTDILKELNHGPQHFDTKHFLCYYYYGGMIYAALKQFDQALFFFEIAVTTPAVAVSAIMTEAYKKYELVSLIVHGEARPLPTYKSSVVQRFIKQSCNEYNRIVSVYTGATPVVDKATALREHLEDARQIFDQDGNVGLVKQVIQSLHKRNIQRLTKTFLTLSLTDVANRCRLNGGATEAEQYIVQMIESGEISAVIDQENGMVHFKDSSALVDSATVDAQMQRVMALEKVVRRLDTDAQLNPQYVSKMAKGSSGLYSTGPVLHDDEGVSIQNFIPGFHVSDMMSLS